jgi:nitrogen regulatory protein PII
VEGVEGTVKLVKCIVREDKVDVTTDALKELDVSGVTVTHVLGRGRREMPKVAWRGCEYEMRHQPQMMIDIVVDDYLVDDIIRIVMDVARTGGRGDGRIFVMPVEEAYTIRTRAGGVD